MRVRIKFVASILILFIVVFTGFWTYEYWSRVSPHVFTKNWAEYNIVDDTVTVTPMMRFLAALFYIPVFIVTYFTSFFALRLLSLYKKGIIFSYKASNALIGLGIGLIGVLVTDTLISSIEPSFLTLWNENGPLAPRYYYDAGDITIGICGIAFIMIGWVTKEAITIEQENKAIL